jgi:hypothetical protein
VLAPKLDALVAHAAAVLKARDAAVWTFWLGGAPVPFEQTWAGNEALLNDDALKVIRRARDLQLKDVAMLDALEALCVSERVGRTVRDAESALANLEASARFTFEGRELLYRELSTSLASEKSPSRRLAMWQASAPAAERIAAAAAQRDQLAAQALVSMGFTPESFASLAHGVDLEAYGQWADRFLLATDARWKARLARAQVTSPADLPAMLKASAALDSAFPKTKEAERGTQLLAGLGLYGLGGLTLDLNDNPRKQPLPLTLALGGPDDVRLSFRPRGGFKDQQLLLAELGRALALKHAPASPLPLRRRSTEATAALFASLATNRAWLDAQGLGNAAATGLELAGDQRLLSVRLGAGALLTELSDPPNGDFYARAKGFAPSSDNVWRWRVESEPSFAAVETLRSQTEAAALARHLETEVGPKWWSSPKAGDMLREYWKNDTLPEAVHAIAANGEALLAQLGAPQAGGVGVSLEAAPPAIATDGGTTSGAHAGLGSPSANDAGATPPTAAAPTKSSRDAGQPPPAAPPATLPNVIPRDAG